MTRLTMVAALAAGALIAVAADAQVLYTLESPNVEDHGCFGQSVAGAADVNGDGCDDIVVGAPFEDGVGLVNSGHAYVFSGNGGDLLYTLESPTPEVQGFFGRSVSSAGDVDGDGFDDLVVGAHEEDHAASGDGRAYIFSGNGGGLLHTFVSPNAENYARFGCAVSGAGDVNADGRADVIVGADREDAGAWNGGRTYVFNGIEVPIELASFAGEPCDGGVRLIWLTLTEKDNLGFNLDRAPVRTGAFVRLNERIIPGAGTSTVPHSYEYLDRGVEPGTTYWYRLEDVSLDGERTLHGPISVAVPDRPKLGLQVLGGLDPTFVLTFQQPGRASLKLYDSAGRLAATPWEGHPPAGGSTTVRAELGRELPTGLYTASLEQSGRLVRRPVVIAR